jgi:hypothetical protein
MVIAEFTLPESGSSGFDLPYQRQSSLSVIGFGCCAAFAENQLQLKDENIRGQQLSFVGSVPSVRLAERFKHQLSPSVENPKLKVFNASPVDIKYVVDAVIIR